MERETIVEIEPLVPQAASAYFSEPNFDVLHNPKVQVRIDDGRHYLLTAKERFDGITVDPLDPWVKGAANLYTKEFLEVMKQRLNPGGVVTMYIQLFETDLERSRARSPRSSKSFRTAPSGATRTRARATTWCCWARWNRCGSISTRWSGASTTGMTRQKVQSLAEVGMNSPVDLFATYAGRKSDLTEWLKDAAINRDRNLRMQYLAGIGLNLDDSAAIYAGMLAYRRFPEDLFAAPKGGWTRCGGPWVANGETHALGATYFACRSAWCSTDLIYVW